MDLAIRPARAGDAARLTAIARAAKAHWGYPESWIALWNDDLTVTPHSIERQAVFCATREAAIVGFYALSSEGAVFELEHLWIDPPAMGRGIGRELLTHAVATAAACGAERLRIAADPNAEGFYRHLGARLIGRVPSMPEGRTLPLLEMALSAPEGGRARGPRT